MHCQETLYRKDIPAELDLNDQPEVSISEINATMNKNYATHYLETLHKSMLNINNYDISFLMGFQTMNHNYLTLANGTGTSVII